MEKYKKCDGMIIVIVIAIKSEENALFLSEKQLHSQIPTNQPNMPIPKLYRKNNWQ